MSAQAQLFTPAMEAAAAMGRVRGPRELAPFKGMTTRYVAEMARALFAVQKDEGQTDSELFGELLEKYVIESAPDVFGLELHEYVAKRERGELVTLKVRE